MHYYHLIAGLPDLSYDDDKTPYRVENFKQQLYEIMPKTDKKLVHDLFLKYDNNNLLSFLRDENAVFDTKGSFSHKEIAHIVQIVREETNQSDKTTPHSDDETFTGLWHRTKPFNKKMPPYFKGFISDYITGDEALKEMFWEDRLASLYYDYLGQSKNKFVSDWAELNLNINNVMIALACRRNGKTHAPYIVGNNAAANTLRNSNARDFGLTEIFPQFDQIRRIDEGTNLIEKEQNIDRLRWEWIEEENTFNYFTIERVIGYLFKLQMMERWMLLNDVKGKQIFKDIVNNLKKTALNPVGF